MVRAEEFEHVRLRDGREGAVVEVLGGGVAFFVDIGSQKTGWQTDYIEARDIDAVLRNGQWVNVHVKKAM